jgi:hypothetical protein
MFLILFVSGANADGEGKKYINEANQILNYHSLKNEILSYSYVSYSLFITFFVKFSISFSIASFLQILLSYFAGVCIYDLILTKSKNNNLAILIFLLYFLSYPIQKWVFYIYSEAVHTSLVIIGTNLYFRLIEKFSVKKALFFLLVLVLIFTTRPVGIIFFLSCFITTAIHILIIGKKQAFFILSCSSILLLIIVLNSPFRYYVNPDSLRRMEIICQVPCDSCNTLPYTAYNKTGLVGAIKVIKNEIGFNNFCLNGLKKMKSFFGLTRPYFSSKHNFFISIYLFLYPFAIFGLLLYKRTGMVILKFFCISYISITTLCIFITCDDWSNRFIAPVFPFIIILAALGFFTLYSRIMVKRSTSI